VHRLRSEDLYLPEGQQSETTDSQTEERNRDQMTIEDPFTAPPKDAEDDTFDPAEVARTELATEQVLPPEDLLPDVGPMGQLLYLEQLTWYVLTTWTGMISAADDGVLDDDSEPLRALQAITLAAGMIDQACVIVSLLPPEAVDGAPTPA
jgi:hypothetical protein